jgi:sugar phosphate isomerase/epimerase
MMRVFAGALAASCLILSASAARAADAPPATEQMLIPHVNQQAMDKLGFRFGVQIYTFREMTAFEALDIMKKLGIHYVEFFGGQKMSKDKNVNVGPDMGDDNTQALLAKCKECDVKPVAFGVTGLSGNEAQDRKTFDWAKKMGLETIVSEPKPDKAVFDVIDKLCEEYNINMAMHDHPKPSTYWNPDLVAQMSEGRSKHIGSCADTGHWVRSGLDPVECVKKLKGRVIEAHLKDVAKDTPARGENARFQRPGSERFKDVPWGTGIVNAKGVMQELKNQGAHINWDIEYESTHGQELINNVAKSYQAFSDMCVELAK